jgi:hypothetical protein
MRNEKPSRFGRVTRDLQVRNLSRIFPQFRLAFAAMLTAPRSVAICLILLCGIAESLCAQTASSQAPGSVLYLRERVAIKTKIGITALEPGTGVRLVSENGNALSVTDGTTTFDVPKEKLTANINEANVRAENYYVTEQAAAQSFNAEIVRQERERKLAFEQQRLTAERQARLEAEEQKKIAAERQAQFEAQAAVQRQQLANWQAAKTDEQREREIRELHAEVNAARIEAARARREAQAAATLNGPEINQPHH